MKKEIATLAGGCFWGMQELIDTLPGVISSRVGYTGGTLENPTYALVSTGNTHHAEAVRLEFDPDELSYDQLLDFFFRIHDPTTLNQQGNDRGTQYRSVIFYHSEEQKIMANSMIRKIDSQKKWKNPIITEVVPATSFYPAEEYHQNYLKKNPGGYTCHWIRE